LLSTPVALSDRTAPEGQQMAVASIDLERGDFRALAMRISDQGLMDPRLGYYGRKIGLTLAAFAAGWAGVLLLGNSWISLALAAFLAVMFTQLAFIAHDAGHQQIFPSRGANHILGLIMADALIGLSFGWWVPKHSAHHAHPNQIGRDPDIAAGLIAFTFASDIERPRGPLTRYLARRQGALFFPLLLLEGLGLHISGVQDLLKRRDRSAAVEASLLAVHAALYLTVVFWALSPLKALAFVVVQQSLFGLYLGCSFAPNHKGMPIVEGDTAMSFAFRQVTTARNVSGGRVTNLMLGGLNYQIEHHLFPSMPRPNLSRARGAIRSFCLESGLGYTEVSLLRSYRLAIGHLRAVAAARALVTG
jgi:fatty acid desaturase